MSVVRSNVLQKRNQGPSPQGFPSARMGCTPGVVSARTRTIEPGSKRGKMGSGAATTSAASQIQLAYQPLSSDAVVAHKLCP